MSKLSDPSKPPKSLNSFAEPATTTYAFLRKIVISAGVIAALVLAKKAGA